LDKERLLQLLQSMSLEEKAGQLTQIPLSLVTQGISAPTGPMQECGLTPETTVLCGSLICDMDSDAEVSAAAIRRMTDAHPHHIPPVLMRDVVHGHRTVFPIPLALGCTFDPELAEQMGRVMAAEGRASNIHATFAPMVDVVRDPRWGRVMESSGESPELCAQMGAATVRGLRAEGMAGCVKHYAAYGLCEAGRDYAPIDVSRTELYNTYLPPFEAAVRAGCEMVMSSFEAVDRIPCVCNEWMLRDVLRGRMGFEGMTISDYADVSQLVNHGVAGDLREASCLALEAGMDMDMTSYAYVKHLADLVRSGDVDERLLDEACLRVLELKNSLGLFERAVWNDDSARMAAAVLTDEARACALAAAQRSCVLLKNGQALPLAAGARVALCGDFADSRALLGGWSLDGRHEDVQTLREVLTRDARLTLVDEAQADTILFTAGETEEETGEDKSKTHLELPKGQVDELLRHKKMGKRVVLLLFAGRPFVLTDVLALCDAVLLCWFPGTMGAEAVRSLIMGDEAPSGHLSMTFPRSVGQIPIHHDQLSSCRPFVQDTIYVSRYLDESNDPLLPFGFGLSYTTFEFEQPSAEAEEGRFRVSVRVRNSGGCEGETVVQLYARPEKGRLIRPVRRLVAFRRVRLAAGEEKEVVFDLEAGALAVYDAQGKAHLPFGSISFFVGESSADTRACSVQV